MRKKALLSLLVGLLALWISVALVGCGPTPDPEPAPSGDPVQYSLRLETLEGRRLRDVTVMIKDGAGNIKKIVTTDLIGEAVFTLPERSDYVAVPDGLQGYALTESYPLSRETVISLVPQLIADESLDGVLYYLGDVMHDLTLTTVDGERFSLSETLQSKKAVVINFFFSTCGPCRSEAPYFEAAYQQYGEDVAFLAVVPGYPGENADKAASFRDNNGLTFDVAYTSSDALAEAFRLSAYPTTVIVDRYGTVCLMETGAISSAEPLLTACAYFTADDYKQKLFTAFSKIEG